jgi:hypothetical protein
LSRGYNRFYASYPSKKAEAIAKNKELLHKEKGSRYSGKKRGRRGEKEEEKQNRQECVKREPPQQNATLWKARIHQVELQHAESPSTVLFVVTWK